MIKTDEQIQQEVFNYIKSSALRQSIKGQLVKDRRPDDRNEDIVVKVLSNAAGHPQYAYLNVNIYVPDIYGKNRYEKNTARLNALGTIAAEIFEARNIGMYRLELESQHTIEQEETHEHFINCKILYRFINA